SPAGGVSLLALQFGSCPLRSEAPPRAPQFRQSAPVARNLPPASLPSAPRRSLCLVLLGAHSLLPQPRNLSNWLFFFALPSSSPLPSGPLLLIPCCLPLPLHRLGHLPCPISRSYISFNY